MCLCWNACVVVALWELLLVCVGDLFLARFLCCQSILCVSDYLSSPARSSAYSQITPPLLPFPSLPHSLSFSVTPASLLSFSLCLLFSESVYPGRKGDAGVSRLVVSLITLFCLFFLFFFFNTLEAFNHETSGVGLHENCAKAC